MEQAPGGKRPAGDGWFVANAREAQWNHNESFGALVTFEGSERLGYSSIWPNYELKFHAARDQHPR